ncbi:MAG: glycerate kinase [Candidatus Kapaibacterium sp.]
MIVEKRYFIVTESPVQGLSAMETASIVARGVRTVEKEIKTENLVQLPLIDGGTGTLEQLVTLTLGSFLEVEATNAEGEDAIIPLGFVSEGGRMAAIEMKAVSCLSTPSDTNSAECTGTTYGVGELIRDAVDEGAFSVILGWDEPLARDAGLGIAAAIGVKFYDAKEAELDLKKVTPDLLSRITRVDATARPFEMLTARLFVAKARSILELEKNFEPKQSSAFVEQLERIAEILKRDCDITIPNPSSHAIGSGVSFGLTAFFTSEFRNGGTLLLEAVNFAEMLSHPKADHLLVVTSSLEEILSERSETLQVVLSSTESSGMPGQVIVRETPAAATLKAFKKKYGLISDVYALSDAPLFAAPLAATASDTDRRRDALLRFEKLLPKVLAAQPHAEVRRPS